MSLAPRRKCAEYPQHGELHEGDKTGLVPRIVVEMHKFLAWAKVAALESQGEDKETMPLHTREGLKIVAAFALSTSPRVNLLLRASTPLRTVVEQWRESFVACLR